MEEKRNIMSRKGLARLEEELEQLKVVKRKEIAEKIKEAREQGDVSENAEYDAALNEQVVIESRVEEIEEIIKYAVVVDDNLDDDTVGIGRTVKFIDLTYNEEMEYTIVGSTEADILQGLMSNDSPIGQALIGAHAGDEVEAETPEGIARFRIIEVSKDEN